MKKILALVLIAIFAMTTFAYASDFDYTMTSEFKVGTVQFTNATLGGNPSGTKYYINDNPAQNWRSIFREVKNETATVDGATVYAHEVVTDPEDESNKYMKFNPIAATSSLYMDCPGTTEGKVDFSMDIRVDQEAGNGTADGSFAISFKNNWNYTDTALNVKLGPTANNKYYLYVTDEANHSWGGNINSTLEVGTWYTLHLFMNYPKGTYRAWVTCPSNASFFKGTVYKGLYQTKSDKSALTQPGLFTTMEISKTASTTFGVSIDNIGLKLDNVVIKSEPTIATDDTNVTATAAVKKGNGMNKGYAPYLILATYNADGELVSAKIDENGGTELPASLPYGTNTELSCSLPKPAGDFSAKAFLWNDITNYKPVSFGATYPAE